MGDAESVRNSITWPVIRDRVNYKRKALRMGLDPGREGVNWGQKSSGVKFVDVER